MCGKRWNVIWSLWNMEPNIHLNVEPNRLSIYNHIQLKTKQESLSSFFSFTFLSKPNIALQTQDRGSITETSPGSVHIIPHHCIVSATHKNILHLTSFDQTNKNNKAIQKNTQTTITMGEEVDTAFVQAPEHRPKSSVIVAEGIPLIDLSPINYQMNLITSNKKLFSMILR